MTYEVSALLARAADAFDSTPSDALDHFILLFKPEIKVIIEQKRADKAANKG